MNYREINGTIRGITDDGYIFQLIARPGLENLEGRDTQTGIRVPKTGRWIVFPEQVIEEHHVKEIKRFPSILPTLFIGVRGGGPIIQAVT